MHTGIKQQGPESTSTRSRVQIWKKKTTCMLGLLSLPLSPLSMKLVSQINCELRICKAVPQQKLLLISANGRPIHWDAVVHTVALIMQTKQTKMLLNEPAPCTAS